MARVAIEGADPEAGVRAPVEQRWHQQGQIGGVVLEVGVEDRREVAARMGQRRLDGRPLALVVVMLEQPHAPVPVTVAQDLAGPVGRAVVDDDQLELVRQLGCEHLGDRALDTLTLVIDGHQDRQHLGSHFAI